MWVCQTKYAGASAMVQLKASGRSRMVVAKHRVLGCLLRADGSHFHHLNRQVSAGAEPPLASAAAKVRFPPVASDVAAAPRWSGSR